jgi:L-malate glycosyltransferase
MKLKENKTILVVCSWLGISPIKVGSFFWEQAYVSSNEYNIILCHFSVLEFGIRTFSRCLNPMVITKEIAPNGIVCYQVKYVYSYLLPAFVNDYFYKRALKNFILFLETNGEKPSLIHAQSLMNAGFHTYHMHKMFNIPYIFTEQNQLSLRKKTTKELKILEEILSNPYPKIAVSYDKIRQFAANTLFADFIVVGNLVDDTIFNYTNSRYFDKNSILKIVSIGAYTPIKDQKTILKALKILDDKNLKNIEFTWVGCNGWGGDKKSEAQELIESFDYKNIKIVIIPTLGRNEIAALFNQSDLYLMASISEGMPISPIEALACGVPVCTTRCGGVDEIIDESNGIIVQIKDENAIANFILSILHDYNFDKAQISKDIISKMGNEAFKNRLNNIYKSIIND